MNFFGQGWQGQQPMGQNPQFQVNGQQQQAPAQMPPQQGQFPMMGGLWGHSPMFGGMGQGGGDAFQGHHRQQPSYFAGNSGQAAPMAPQGLWGGMHRFGQ